MKKKTLTKNILIYGALTFLAGSIYYTATTLPQTVTAENAHPVTFTEKSETSATALDKNAGVVQETKNSSTTNAAKKPNTLTVLGKEITYYSEIGQEGINQDHQKATTWGGEFTHGQNKPTLIAGHDDGPMGVIKNLKSGDTVTITDGEGREYHYIYKSSRQIAMDFDGQGSGYVATEEDDLYLNEQLDAGEKLNLQTCLEIHATGYTVMIVTLVPAG